ncbi:MAG: hypothetical protein M1830_008532 [Pleopsidium flavum]|nr:MAG: hypothetical protein M1830_008532 [Pleopsidium flavum]
MPPTSPLRVLIPPSPLPTSPLPTALRSEINSALLQTGSIQRIQTTLLHQLQASGWTENVRSFCLELLRSGECASWGEVMGRVLRDAGVGRIGGEEEEEGKEGVGNGGVNGDGANEEGAARKKAKLDVRIPEKVINEGIKVVREALEEVVEIVGDEE